MCGIVGYTGNKNSCEILLSSLARLEYRGYDSAGIAIIGKRALELYRKKGKVACLKESIAGKNIYGTTGLGHTRWATHGRPSEENAHPHTDCKKKLVVIHNGIIENYLSLKKKLISSGHVFKSETDTEVIAHLIEQKLKQKKTLLSAVQTAVKELRGSYALGVMSVCEPGTIVAARKDSPLVIGLGKEENFIASDIPAILPYTRKIIAMDEGETALISKNEVTVYGKTGNKIKKTPSIITWDPVMAEKGGFKHFMLKEIFEQPRAIQDTFRGRIDAGSGQIFLDEINLTPGEIKNFKRILFVACGTAHHAGLIGRFLVENLANIPCEVDIGSEFRYRKTLLNKDDLVVLISQSGETADTLAGLRLAKKNGIKTVVICNVVDSTAAREADGIIYTHAGPEIGVASTKAFTAQLTALYLFSLYLGRIRGKITRQDAKKFLVSLTRIPSLIRNILKKHEKIKTIAKKYFKKTGFLYIGRSFNYPIALEGALKLKEISYTHAEGYPAGEMKHGPIALIDEDMPVVALAPKSALSEKMFSNIQEAKSRSAAIVAITTQGEKNIKNIADEIFYIPETIEEFTPILNIIPLQLLAYYIAAFRGCDIDQPRNLAKSVVVE